MKKNIIMILFGLFVISCVTTKTVHKPDPYASLSVKTVSQNCTPVESWRVGLMGVPGFVVVFDDCLKIKKLVIISLYTASYTREISDTSANLLSMHYVEFLKRRSQSAGGDKSSWVLKKIKEENNAETTVVFYELLEKKPTCDDGVCRGSSK